MLLIIIILICLSIGVFSPNDNKQITDFELYGDIDPFIYGKCMASKEYEKGYLSAKKLIISDKLISLTSLEIEKNKLSNNNDFHKGWEDFFNKNNW